MQLFSPDVIAGKFVTITSNSISVRISVRISIGDSNLRKEVMPSRGEIWDQFQAAANGISPGQARPPGINGYRRESATPSEARWMFSPSRRGLLPFYFNFWREETSAKPFFRLGECGSQCYIPDIY